MPKQTFFNLPQKKKKRIIDAAVDEFAENPYLKTSTNRIIEKADISKGSFYQYFDNKKDVYKYIIECAEEKKMKFLNDKLADYEDLDFFEMLRDLYIASIEFRKKYPLLSQIGNRLLDGENESLKKEIYEDSKPKSRDFFKKMLFKAAAEGEVDKSIDIDFTAYLLTDLSVSIVNYFFQKHTTDNVDNIIEYVDKMLILIKNGIAEEGKNAISKANRT